MEPFVRRVVGAVEVAIREEPVGDLGAEEADGTLEEETAEEVEAGILVEAGTLVGEEEEIDML